MVVVYCITLHCCGGFCFGARTNCYIPHEISYACFLSLLYFIAQGLGHGHGHGHGQDLVLHLITETRNTKEDTRTTGSSGATTAASGGRTTSGAEGEGTSHVVASSVVVGVAAAAATTTTTTSAQTGRTTSSTLKSNNNNNNNNNNSKTIIEGEGDRTISRNAQRAPLMATLTALTDPPRHYPDFLSIRLPPRTHPLPNAGQPCCWITRTPKMWKRRPQPQRRPRREEGRMGVQWSLSGRWQEMPKKEQAVRELRGAGRAGQTAAAVQREPVLSQILLLMLVRAANRQTSLPPLRTQMTTEMVPPRGRRCVVHPLLKKPHMKVWIQCFPALTSSPLRNTWMEINRQSPLPSESKADFTFLLSDHFWYCFRKPCKLCRYTNTMLGVIVYCLNAFTCLF